MKSMLEYDKTDPYSIERYAQQLVGRTFADVCKADAVISSSIIDDNDEYNASAEDKKQKGSLGTLIEERFFHYPANGDSRPDFFEAGVELKVTPYRINSGKKVAKERLIITMIDYNEVVNETFETSHLWAKSRRILLIYYLYLKEAESKLDYRIDYARLFTPPEADLAIIKHDYEVIIEKIKAGKAHELSESDTMYLGAATKAATSKNRRSQPFSNIPAKPRAFAFKSSYMTYVLNNYIVGQRPKFESIIKDKPVGAFEEYVVGRINEYKDSTIDELCEKFGIEKKSKSIGALIAFRILGVKGNDAEEFEKAGIRVKTIRLEASGRIKESMSFPTFKFKELVKQDWEDSDFRNYLLETRFFFIVYQFNKNGQLFLKGCQFWNIPYNDLEGNVKDVWNETKKVLQEGLKVNRVNGYNENNFPKAANNSVCHVRPHAQNAKDTYELPDGRQYPKQCFWLNNNYILSQLNDELKG